MLELPKGEINCYQLFKYNGWTFEEISIFKSKIVTEINQNDLYEFLMTIYEYKISFNEITSYNPYQLHKNIIKKIVPNNTLDKDIKFIIEEHSNILKEKKLVQCLKSEENIIQRINKIKNLVKYYKENNNINITKKNIKKQTKLSEDDLIALVMKGIEEIKKYTLKDSQIFALLSLLKKNKHRGKIAQILTGEGKTIIINSLAIIKVLNGHKVDIVTSNPLLAERDCSESKSLYQKFGISVDNNVDEYKLEYSDLIEKKKKKYAKDVIYGTTYDFQDDILRDEYELTGIRNKREFDIVIVDEIDSMLIDEYEKRTLLSSPKPFFEKYSLFLQIIWGFYKNIINNNEYNEEEVAHNDNFCEKLKKFLNEKMINIINNSNIFISMSNHSRKFALEQVDKWINSLIISIRMKKDVEYIIKNGIIIPVDHQNTGRLEKK